MTPSGFTLARGPLLLLTVLVEGGFLVLAWAAGAALDVHPFGTWRWSMSAVGWGTAAGGALLGAVALALRSHYGPLTRLRHHIEKDVAPLFSRCAMVDLVAISVAAGIGEEALFRGFAQLALGQALGPAAALMVASLIFGLFHAISIVYAVYAAVVGVYLGGLLLLFDNLVVPVVAHALFDFLGLSYLVWRTRRAHADPVDRVAPAQPAPVE